MESKFWIKIFSVIMIEYGNLELKLSISCICELKRNPLAMKDYKLSQPIKLQQNNISQQTLYIFNNLDFKNSDTITQK